MLPAPSNVLHGHSKLNVNEWIDLVFVDLVVSFVLVFFRSLKTEISQKLLDGLP